MKWDNFRFTFILLRKILDLNSGVDIFQKESWITFFFYQKLRCLNVSICSLTRDTNPINRFPRYQSTLILSFGTNISRIKESQNTFFSSCIYNSASNKKNIKIWASNISCYMCRLLKVVYENLKKMSLSVILRHIFLN